MLTYERSPDRAEIDTEVLGMWTHCTSSRVSMVAEQLTCCLASHSLRLSPAGQQADSSVATASRSKRHH